MRLIISILTCIFIFASTANAQISIKDIYDDAIIIRCAGGTKNMDTLNDAFISCFLKENAPGLKSNAPLAYVLRAERNKRISNATAKSAKNVSWEELIENGYENEFFKENSNFTGTTTEHLVDSISKLLDDTSKQVFQMIESGYTGREISEALGISPAKVSRILNTKIRPAAKHVFESYDIFVD